jgi:Zn2+/Cd2+-exporting ATPase
MSQEEESCELPQESVDEIISRRWFEYPPIRNAIIAGALTTTLFLLSLTIPLPSYITIPGYVLGVVIGGYYWFSEGVKELVEEHHVNISILMAFATAASAALGLWEEAAFLAFLYGAAEGIEEYTDAKTRGSIRKLLDLVPKEATLLDDGKERKVLATDLKVGDTFLVRPGESIPTDGVVVKGPSTVDESPVTGESIPVTKKEGMKVFAATMNKEGALEVRATASFSECSVAKTIHMVEEAQEQKGRAQQFIERFGNIYSPAVLGFAFLLILLPYPLGLSTDTWATRAVVFIVAAAPCALVMSTPVSIATAIGKAGRRGVLVKGGVHIENLGKVKVVAFDKTGTLTKGKLVVTDVIGLTKSDTEILHLAHCVERCSEHPIACAINERGATCPIEPVEAMDFRAVIGLGAQARVGDELVYVGQPELFQQNGVSAAGTATINKLRTEGKTVILVGTGKAIAGLIALKDEPRPEARQMIADLDAMGIRTVMLTGDNDVTANAVAKDLGITEVRASLKPQDKIAAIKELRSKYGAVAMIGDGINDAPALAEATVGVAMGAAGTDAAIEAADVALMADDLSKVPYALRIGRRSNHLGRQNIAFALIVLALMIPSALFGILSVALAVIFHEASELIAVGNGLRVGRRGDGDRIIK